MTNSREKENDCSAETTAEPPSTYLVASPFCQRFPNFFPVGIGRALFSGFSGITRFRQAMNFAVAAFLWLGFTLPVLVRTHGKWGVTPGKWSCGLRVVQTTLKSCGFVRSLTREVTLARTRCASKLPRVYRNVCLNHLAETGCFMLYSTRNGHC